MLSGPTRMCFIFFHRTKILKFYCQPTNGTFAFAPTHDAIPSAKSIELFSLTASGMKVIIISYIAVLVIITTLRFQC
jgi:hypothetical protein